MKLYNLQKKHLVLPVTAALVGLIVLTSVFPQAVQARAASVIEDFASRLVEEEVKPQFPETEDVAPSYEIWVLATAYSSDVGQTDSTPCIPAMWTFNLCTYYKDYGHADTIAANFLPLGKKVRFELKGNEGIGDHRYTVRDRMNSKYNGTRRIDIWMPTRAQAVAFGVRRMKMKVYPYR